MIYSYKIEIEKETDILIVKESLRTLCKDLKFSILNQTQILTAVSEIVRNTLVYAGTGKVTLERIEENNKIGIKTVVSDHGPGIPDIELALVDGYTTGQGLGKGLGGSKRLVDFFKIQSSESEGTKVEMIKWKR